MCASCALPLQMPSRHIIPSASRAMSLLVLTLFLAHLLACAWHSLIDLQVWGLCVHLTGVDDVSWVLWVHRVSLVD